MAQQVALVDSDTQSCHAVVINPPQSTNVRCPKGNDNDVSAMQNQT
jgi:hypothetical protein